MDLFFSILNSNGDTEEVIDLDRELRDKVWSDIQVARIRYDKFKLEYDAVIADLTPDCIEFALLQSACEAITNFMTNNGTGNNIDRDLRANIVAAIDQEEVNIIHRDNIMRVAKQLYEVLDGNNSGSFTAAESALFCPTTALRPNNFSRNGLDAAIVNKLGNSVVGGQNAILLQYRIKTIEKHKDVAIRTEIVDRYNAAPVPTTAVAARELFADIAADVVRKTEDYTNARVLDKVERAIERDGVVVGKPEWFVLHGLKLKRSNARINDLVNQAMRPVLGCVAASQVVVDKGSMLAMSRDSITNHVINDMSNCTGELRREVANNLMHAGHTFSELALHTNISRAAISALGL